MVARLHAAIALLMVLPSVAYALECRTVPLLPHSDPLSAPFPWEDPPNTPTSPQKLLRSEILTLALGRQGADTTEVCDAGATYCYSASPVTFPPSDTRATLEYHREVYLVLPLS